MEKRIKDTLKELEQRHQIKILFACETGSRAWGFPSPDSDYDVRMLYVHEPGWYLSLFDKKDTIEFMSEDEELDITGWDIKKCLQLMLKSNASVFERLQSPIVYSEEDNASAMLYGYAERCFSPIATMYHYLGLANNSFAEVNGKDEIKLKKLFYSLRATLACKWILEKNAIPPMLFSKMVDDLAFDSSLKKRINELMILKSGKNESYLHPPEHSLQSFITSELEKATTAAAHLTARKEKEVDLDTVFKQLIKFV